MVRPGLRVETKKVVVLKRPFSPGGEVGFVQNPSIVGSIEDTKARSKRLACKPETKTR